jgi:hypothetical protein
MVPPATRPGACYDARVGRRGLGSVLDLLGGTVTWFMAIEWLARLQGLIWARRLAVRPVLPPPWWMQSLPWRILVNFVESTSIFLTCTGGGLAMLAVLAARYAAAVRVRRGKADPLESLRSGRMQRLLGAAPWVVFVTTIARQWDWDAAKGLAAVAAGALGYFVARMCVRTLLAPAQIESAGPKRADEIVFWAVPVTPRTRGAVRAFGAALLAMLAVVAVTGSEWFLYAFMATAVLVPFAFRRASRIAVGIDGVWVRDASRVRFFAYRDLDEARAQGADLELVSRGRMVLRLQMHGEDATQRDEVIARVNAGIARSRDASSRGAEMIVQTVRTSDVAATTNGADQYRLPSISRDQLWQLVEGSTADASTRTAAAEALAITLDPGDRARLRVAATQCVEPRLRVTLEDLAGSDEEEDAERDAAQRRCEQT